jgi:hypothetical protein
MAFEFPRAEPKELFFPTDGKESLASSPDGATAWR